MKKIFLRTQGRKIFLFMMVSVDGYFEGPNHDISWHSVDEEFNEFAQKQTKEVSLMMFGKRTYELMRDYWPTELALQDDPLIADLMNNTPKVVFSTTLGSVKETEHWKNVRLVSKDSIQEVKKLKEEGEGFIAIFGSNTLAVSLMEEGLIDEFRIIINPVVLGEGTPLFKGLKSKLNLKLLSIREFKNGNILLTYTPSEKPTVLV